MRSLAAGGPLAHWGRYRLVLTRGCGSTLIALFVGQLAGLRAWFGVNRLGRCSLSGGRFGAGCHVRGEWSGVVLRVQLGLEFMKFLRGRGAATGLRADSWAPWSLVPILAAS